MSAAPLFECETIIFGKGIGESIIIRLSENEWMIIDSCLNDNKNPAALDYLKSRGADIENDVKLIMISHFHDDHIKGLSQIIEQCKSSLVVISAALNTAEFKEYISALSANGQEMAKTKEIDKIMNLLPELARSDRIRYAKRDCLLFRSSTDIEVHALSPCDIDITRSNLDFANSLKTASNFKEIASSASIVNPNHYCVVTRINSSTSSNNEILLGADLEVSGATGWEAVCNALNSPKNRKTGLFKLPHHGSQTGFHQRTWDELIKEKPVTVLTTYSRSNLPRDEMIQVYKDLSSQLYCASDPYKKPDKKKERSNISEAADLLKKMGSTVKFANNNSQFGYISFKKCLSPNLSVQPFLAAKIL